MNFVLYCRLLFGYGFARGSQTRLIYSSGPRIPIARRRDRHFCEYLSSFTRFRVPTKPYRSRRTSVRARYKRHYNNIVSYYIVYVPIMFSVHYPLLCLCVRRPPIKVRRLIELFKPRAIDAQTINNYGNLCQNNTLIY
jgi:hypothetical protein